MFSALENGFTLLYTILYRKYKYIYTTEKDSLNIEDYSISQTSLEQIFNQFAAQQEEETGSAAGIQR